MEAGRSTKRFKMPLWLVHCCLSWGSGSGPALSARVVRVRFEFSLGRSRHCCPTKAALEITAL